MLVDYALRYFLICGTHRVQVETRPQVHTPWLACVGRLSLSNGLCRV